VHKEKGFEFVKDEEFPDHRSDSGWTLRRGVISHTTRVIKLGMDDACQTEQLF
jgi:hypothetical protein